MAFVQAKATGALNPDAVLSSLRQYCPGTEVLDADYCASRMARLAEMLRTLGEPSNNRVFESAMAAAGKLGVTRQIRVPLREGEELVGTIHMSGLLLSTKQALSSEAVAPLLAALASVPQLQVSVSLAGLYDRSMPHPSRQPKKRPWWKFWQSA
jgi:hypothetical protein